MDIKISERMGEELQMWVDHERGYLPQDTAYQADLESLARQLDAGLKESAARRSKALAALIADSADGI